ncbi:unnamed protein product [Danaus chrysippus]|uniref:(African queen) hypothetical protein n=1 Tax=Danaus chrysippus TaxID=151541 RepID=A0A8J2QMN2_9NEOP|nr:unnamed protein product [Danaus chrysippus]
MDRISTTTPRHRIVWMCKQEISKNETEKYKDVRGDSGGTARRTALRLGSARLYSALLGSTRLASASLGSSRLGARERPLSRTLGGRRAYIYTYLNNPFHQLVKQIFIEHTTRGSRQTTVPLVSVGRACWTRVSAARVSRACGTSVPAAHGWPSAPGPAY